MYSNEKAQKDVLAWGKQTIAYTISIRADETGMPLDNGMRLMAANTEAEETNQRFWNQALKENEKGSGDSYLKYIKLVLDFAGSYRNSRA